MSGAVGSPAPDPATSLDAPGTVEVVVVVPVHRNAETLRQLVARLHEVLDGVPGGWAVRLVVDGCTEGSGAVAQELAGTDPHVHVTELARNVGQHQALRRGLLDEPDARAWVCMDADLQDPPEAVPGLLAALHTGKADGVFAGRRGAYESYARRATGGAHRRVLATVTGLPPDAGAFLALTAFAAARRPRGHGRGRAERRGRRWSQPCAAGQHPGSPERPRAGQLLVDHTRPTPPVPALSRLGRPARLPPARHRHTRHVALAQPVDSSRPHADRSVTAPPHQPPPTCRTRRTSMSTTTTSAPPRSRAVLAKVPEVTAVFWAVKLLTTAVGEVASDWMAEHSWLLVGLAGGGGMLAALAWQLRSDRYSAVRYWSLAAMIATFGTAAEDFLVKSGGTHNQGTVLYSALLAGILYSWWRTEGTLSFHAVDTRRRELFYWATVFATFALGTATGDVTSGIWGWGFLNSVWLFAALMVVPLVLWRLGVNTVACFWTAYILTRPLGASISDYLAKPWLGGADLGVPEVTTVGALLLIAAVIWLQLTKRDVQAALSRS